MKRLIVVMTMTLYISASLAMDIKQDTITNNIRSKVDQIYEMVIPILDRLEIDGSSEASQELRKRWSRVVQYMKNNKEYMYQEVKKIMMIPGGSSVSIETVKKFIDLAEDDSVKKIKVNPDFILDELKNWSNKITEISVKMAEKK